MTEAEPRHWTVDRRVPIALVATIFIQTMGLVGVGAWFVSEINGRVTTAEQRIEQNYKRVAIVEARQQDAETLAARLEERIIAQGMAQGDALQRIEALLTELAQRPHRERSR